MRVTSSLLSGIALLAATHGAFAQTDLERATARDAAQSGLAAFQAGHYDQAIDSFSRAEQLVHAPTHLLFLARAQAKVGKLVAAHENYLKVTRETLPPGAPKAFSDAQAAAEQERGPLDARLPSVTITVQGNASNDVAVQMDGAKLPSAMIGIPLPVDPGQHVFTATAPGSTSAPVTVTLPEGGKQTVLLSMGPSTEPPAGDVAKVSTTTDPLVDNGPPKGHGLRTAAYVSFGVGAVGLGLGTVFLLKSGSTRNDSDKLFDACVADLATCDDAKKSAIAAKDSDADGQRNVGVASLIVGGVGVAAGVTLLILDARHQHSSAQSSAPHVTPVFGFRSVGLVGTF